MLLSDRTMNAIFKCEQCGVKKPCVLVMTGAGDVDFLVEPKVCVNGGTATWKLCI